MGTPKGAGKRNTKEDVRELCTSTSELVLRTEHTTYPLDRQFGSCDSFLVSTWLLLLLVVVVVVVAVGVRVAP